MYLCFVANKQQMIAHAQEFRFLTDVEMIPKVLLIGRIIQTVDQILQQLACSISCYFVANLYPGLTKKFSAVIHGMENKGKIIQPEGFLVVVAIH